MLSSFVAVEVPVPSHDRCPGSVRWDRISILGTDTVRPISHALGAVTSTTIGQHALTRVHLGISRFARRLSYLVLDNVCLRPL
jgi:hypothetical protein